MSSQISTKCWNPDLKKYKDQRTEPEVLQQDATQHGATFRRGVQTRAGVLLRCGRIEIIFLLCSPRFLFSPFQMCFMLWPVSWVSVSHTHYAETCSLCSSAAVVLKPGRFSVMMWQEKHIRGEGKESKRVTEWASEREGGWTAGGVRSCLGNLTHVW